MADENVRFKVSAESDLPKVLSDLDALIRKQTQLGDENSTTLKNMNSNLQTHGKQYDTLGNSITGVKNLMIAAFGINEVKEAILKVFDLTATYQKYTAALTVGLGSQKAASEALDILQGYADQTNFTLDELAETFTKLANRGLVVSREEMVKLGDVANTLQKPFGDLVEAILDVNNTERWTELGIKAKTAGDKVQLTFKGVTIECEKTEKGVLAAVAAFGTLNGVQGATAAQALTLAGKLSTLEDSAAGLGRTVGTKLSPSFENAIEAAGGLINVVAGSDSAFDRTVNYIKAAAAALTTYQLVVNATEIKTIALSAAVAAKEVVMKAYTIAVGTSQIAMQALTSAMGANITISNAATTSAKLFWTALSTNPIGLIVTAVGLATSAFYAYKAANAEVNVEIDAATEKLIKERVELQNAVLAVQGYSIGTQERTKAVSALMEKYPGLLGYVDADRVSNLELNKALVQQIELLDSKIKYAAAAAQADAIYNQQIEINKQQIEVVIKLRGAYKELSEAYPDNNKFIAEIEKMYLAENARVESVKNSTTAAMSASWATMEYSKETAKYMELQGQSTELQKQMALATTEVSKASANSTNAQIDDINKQLASLDAAHKAKKVNDDDYKVKRQELLNEIKRLNQEEADDEVVKVAKLGEAGKIKKEQAFLTAKEIAALTKEIQEDSLKDQLDLVDAKMKVEIERINSHKVDYIKTEQDAADAIKAIVIKAEREKEAIIAASRTSITANHIDYVAKTVEIETDLSLSVQASEVQRLLNTQMSEEQKQKVRLDTLEAVRKTNEEEQKVIHETQEIETKSRNERLKAVLGFIGSISSALGDFTNFAIKMVDDIDLISGKTVQTYKTQAENAKVASDAAKIFYGEASTQYADSKLKVAEANQGLTEAQAASSMASLNMVMMVADILQKVAVAINDMLIETNTAIIEAYDTLANVMSDYYDTLIVINKESLDTQLEDFKGTYAEREAIIDEHYAKQTEYAEAKELIEYQAAYTKLTLENDSNMKKDLTASGKKLMGQMLANMYEQQALEEEYRVKKLQREIETAEEARDKKIQALEDELDKFIETKEAEIDKAEEAADAQMDALKEKLDAAKDAYKQETDLINDAYKAQLEALKDKQSQEEAAIKATFELKQKLLEQETSDEISAIAILERTRNEALERYRAEEVAKLEATRNRILATLTDEGEREQITNAFAQKIADVHKEVEEAKLDKSKGVSLAIKQLNQEAKDKAVDLKDQEKAAINQMEDEYQAKMKAQADERDARLKQSQAEYLSGQTELNAQLFELLKAGEAREVAALEAAKQRDLDKAKSTEERAKITEQYDKWIADKHIEYAIAMGDKDNVLLQEREAREVAALEADKQRELARATSVAERAAITEKYDKQIADKHNEYQDLMGDKDQQTKLAQKELEARTTAEIKALKDQIAQKERDVSSQMKQAQSDYANFVLQANQQILQAEKAMAIAKIRAEIAILRGKRNIFNAGKIDSAIRDLESSISELESVMSGGVPIVSVPDGWTEGIKNDFVRQRKEARQVFNADTLDAVNEAFTGDGKRITLEYTDEDRSFSAFNASGGQFTVRNAIGRVYDQDGKVIQEFFKGSPWVDGMGYPDGRDTVPAMINKGERILPTDLNEMVGGRQVSNEKLVERYLAFEKLKQKFGDVRIEEFGRLNFDLKGERLGTSLDLKGLEKEVKELTNVIRSKPELKINVDANRMSIAERSHTKQHVTYYENIYNR